MISRRRRASPVPIKLCMSQVDESACGRKAIQNGKASSWDVARCNFASFSAVNCLTRISGWLPAQTKNCWSPKTKLHKRSFLTQSRFSHIHLKEQRIRLSVSEGQRSSTYSALHLVERFLNKTAGAKLYFPAQFGWKSESLIFHL